MQATYSSRVTGSQFTHPGQWGALRPKVQHHRMHVQASSSSSGFDSAAYDADRLRLDEQVMQFRCGFKLGFQQW